jgi:transketolase
MHFDSHVGHIGGNLSCIDTMVVLFHLILKKDDQFILSKGHSAGAYYATLWSIGKLSESDLLKFHKDDTLLSAHPPAHGIDDILFATGSLGHGLSLASGLALAKKLRSQPGRIYCLMSDGELNEGSCWEALIFAKQQKLSNLTMIVDLNGLQGFGTTKDVADLEPLVDKFTSFGVPTNVVDGHDFESLAASLTNQDVFNIVIAKTHKGNGISYMQDRMEWHYLPMSQEQYELAIREIELS